MLFGCYSSDDATAISTVVAWGVSSLMYDATSGTTLATDGEGVARWVAASQVLTLSQATSGQRPLVEDDLFPGRNGMVFANDDNMAVTPADATRLVLIIVVASSGTRTLFTRDTTAATTKPKYELLIEEYST